LIDEIISLAQQGEDVRKKYPYFVQPVTKVTFCSGNYPYLNKAENMAMFKYGIFILYQMRIMLYLKNNNFQWENQTELCESILSYDSIITSVTNLFEELNFSEKSQYDLSNRTIFLVFIICLISFFCISLTCLIIFSVLTFKELEHFYQNIQNIKSTHRTSAAQPIILHDFEISNDEYNESFSNNGMKLRGLIILNFVFIFITVAFYCVIYILANSQNSTIYNFKGWILSDYRRLGQCQYLLFDTTLLIGISNDIFTLPYITTDFLIEHINLFSEKIQASNLVLLESIDSPSILGLDPKLDKYNMYNICDIFKPVDDIVDSYSCSGLISNYNLIVSLAQSITQLSKSIFFY
jgi:hypothetical protein